MGVSGSRYPMTMEADIKRRDDGYSTPTEDNTGRRWKASTGADDHEKFGNFSIHWTQKNRFVEDEITLSVCQFAGLSAIYFDSIKRT